MQNHTQPSSGFMNPMGVGMEKHQEPKTALFLFEYHILRRIFTSVNINQELQIHYRDVDVVLIDKG